MPKIAAVDATPTSPAPSAVVNPTYTGTANITSTGAVPPALSAAPLTAASSTPPSPPVSIAPLALILGAAYQQQSSSSSSPTAVPTASVTTSAPPVAGTPAVIATIPVDPWALAITKDGNTLYGTSSPYSTDASGMPIGTVQVVNANTNTQVGEPIAVGQFISQGNIVTNPTMNRAYVIAYNPATITNPSTGYSQTGYLPSLVVIDTTTNKVVGNPISLVKPDQTSVTTMSPGPSALAVSPDGSRLYVAGTTITGTYAGQALNIQPTVTVFDTATNTQVGDPIPVGPGSTNLYASTSGASVLVSPDSKRLYVTVLSNQPSTGSTTYIADTTIYTIDAKTGASVGNPIILTNDAGPLVPQTELLSPDGTKLYVESFAYPAITIGSNTQVQSAQEIANAKVLTFNTGTGQQVGTPIDVVGYGVMTLSPDGKTLYVSDVADSRTGKTGSFQPYPGTPSQTLYVGSVTGYNLGTGKTLGKPTTVGLGPTSMVVNSAGTRLYVANVGDNTISVINITPTSSGTPNLLQSFVIGLRAIPVNLTKFVPQVIRNLVSALQKLFLPPKTGGTGGTGGTPNTATLPLKVYGGGEPEINVSVGGGPSTLVIVDTGSKGLAVPFTDVPEAAFTKAEANDANWVNLSYGGGSTNFVGVLVPTTVTIGDAATGQVTTKQTKVIAVVGQGKVTDDRPIFFLPPIRHIKVNSADPDALYNYFNKSGGLGGVKGVLGIGPNAGGSGPVVTTALPGHLSDGELIVITGSTTGKIEFGSPTDLHINGITTQGATKTPVKVQINNGAKQNVTAIFDSGGVYGNIPSGLVKGIKTNSHGQLPEGTKISVYNTSNQLLYQYVVGPTSIPNQDDGPNVSSDPMMNTGFIPFLASGGLDRGMSNDQNLWMSLGRAA